MNDNFFVILTLDQSPVDNKFFNFCFFFSRWWSLHTIRCQREFRIMDYVILNTLSLLLYLKLGYTYVTYPGKGFAYTELTLIWWRIRM